MREVDWREVYDWAGLHVREMISMHYDPVDTEILDVGAGQGKYSLLLPEYRMIDAVEVHEPSVEAYGLRSLYRRVFVSDVVKFVTSPRWYREMPDYSVAVLGDVLEHLDVGDAQLVIDALADRCEKLFVVVPYLYPQGPEDGNEHQRHLQDDLTPEEMARRYSSLNLTAIETRDGRPFKGLYRK